MTDQPQLFEKGIVECIFRGGKSVKITPKSHYSSQLILCCLLLCCYMAKPSTFCSKLFVHEPYVRRTYRFSQLESGLKETIPQAPQLFDKIEYELESVLDHRVRDLMVSNFVPMLKEIRKILLAAQG